MTKVFFLTTPGEGPDYKISISRQMPETFYCLVGELFIVKQHSKIMEAVKLLPRKNLFYQGDGYVVDFFIYKMVSQTTICKKLLIGKKWHSLDR